jgi:hypothetical protein
VLRRIFGPKRGEIIGAWIKLLNDEFHNLYIFVKNISKIINSRRLRLAGHVARIGEKKNACMDLARKPEGRDYY